MKKLLAFAIAAASVAALTSDASAFGGAGPFSQGGQPGRGLFFHKHPVPAFQAAPWYLYWPYNSHFMTPAPLTGPYFAPPYSGGQMVNPYFPGYPAPVAPVAPTQPAAGGAAVPAGGLIPNR